MSILSSDSGLGVLAAIRQNEKLDGIPTAVATSPAARRIIVKSKKAEFDRFITKPHDLAGY